MQKDKFKLKVAARWGGYVVLAKPADKPKAGYKQPVGWPEGGTLFLDREEAERAMEFLDKALNGRIEPCEGEED